MKRFRRIAALAGIILLLGMYGATMFFALSDSPNAKGMLMGAIYCTIAVPVLLYAITLTAKVLDRRNQQAMAPAEEPEKLPEGYPEELPEAETEILPDEEAEEISGEDGGVL